MYILLLIWWLLESKRYTPGGVETSDEWLHSRKFAFFCGIQTHLPCTYTIQHMNTVLINEQLWPDCTEDIPDPANDKDAPSVVQFEEEHSPLLLGHKAGHTVARHSATPLPSQLSHDTSPGLYSHCSNCSNIIVS